MPKLTGWSMLDTITTHWPFSTSLKPIRSPTRYGYTSASIRVPLRLTWLRYLGATGQDDTWAARRGAVSCGTIRPGFEDFYSVGRQPCESDSAVSSGGFGPLGSTARRLDISVWWAGASRGRRGFDGFFDPQRSRLLRGRPTQSHANVMGLSDLSSSACRSGPRRHRYHTGEPVPWDRLLVRDVVERLVCTPGCSSVRPGSRTTPSLCPNRRHGAV